MNKFKLLLKHLASDGATYENWCQYQSLACLAATHWNTKLGETYSNLQTRFFELANLAEFTQEQLSDGIDLDRDLKEAWYFND